MGIFLCVRVCVCVCVCVQSSNLSFNHIYSKTIFSIRNKSFVRTNACFSILLRFRPLSVNFQIFILHYILSSWTEKLLKRRRRMVEDENEFFLSCLLACLFDQWMCGKYSQMMCVEDQQKLYKVVDALASIEYKKTSYLQKTESLAAERSECEYLFYINRLDSELFCFYLSLLACLFLFFLFLLRNKPKRFLLF